ncbi:MAG: hypothetical protein OQL19_04120 [Gammaproteobacteria bacterium]|nr:hypothetical protein [Gammaproteobacteria bacterium]
MKTDTIKYLLDNEDRIISVSGPWDEFANKNDGVNVHASYVCGRSIWDFIVSDATKMWIRTLFQRARLKTESIERPYRCDSPDLKRFMRMSISSCENGVLEVKHEILHVEECLPPVHFKHISENSVVDLRFRCSFCGRVRQEDAWLEPIATDDTQETEMTVEYTVCEDCQNLMHGV